MRTKILHCKYPCACDRKHLYLCGMIYYCPAKINLGLWVLEKRGDGYHNLETLMIPVPWYDLLEMISAPDRQFRFTTSGITIPGNGDQNLVMKAFRLLEQRYSLPPVHIHLHKQIPIGAGLGGGSSNGAAALNLINTLFSLHLNTDERQQLASELGSDCPFFIKAALYLVEGKGRQLTPVAISTREVQCVVVVPGIHISTSSAYNSITPRNRNISILDIVKGPMSQWQEQLTNDFEDMVFMQYPEIQNIKDILYREGAIYAAMSGSGSSVFGLFSNDAMLPLRFPLKGYTVKSFKCISLP